MVTQHGIKHIFDGDRVAVERDHARAARQIGNIALKMQEVTKFRAATHPLEYQLYYHL